MESMGMASGYGCKEIYTIVVKKILISLRQRG